MNMEQLQPGEYIPSGNVIIQTNWLLPVIW